MQVPLSQPDITEAEINEVVDTLRSGWLTSGPKTNLFETNFAEAVDAPKALAFASCAVAVEIALRSLGIGENDAVFVPTMGFASSASAVHRVGARIYFVDCEPIDMNMEPANLQAQIDQARADGVRPTVIMPVHMNGLPANMDAIDAIAFDNGLDIIEDAAHAMPAHLPNRVIGSPLAPLGVRRLTAFSFQATKTLTTGEGGMLTGPDDVLAEAKNWRLHGMTKDAFDRQRSLKSWEYDVVRPGLKANLPDILSAIGIHQLARSKDMLARRTEITDQYSYAFSHLAELELLTEPNGCGWSRYTFPIRISDLTIGRDEFLQRLADKGVQGSVYFKPIHTFSWFQAQGYQPNDYPESVAQYKRLLAVPCHSKLTDAQVNHVIKTVSSIVSETSTF